MKISLNPRLRLNKLSLALLTVVLVFLFATVVSPAVSISANLCGQCHGGYDQRLDLLEGNSQNVIPTSLQVGQSTTVTIALQNTAAAPRYTDLVSVSVRLTSQSGHFIVANPTYNVATLPVGTATATWQITGASAGQDQLFISATGVNTHHRTISLSDNYSPSPAITVSGTGTYSPTPTPIPPITPTSTSTQIPTISPSQPPTTQSAPTPTLSPPPTPIPSSGTTTPNENTPNPTPTLTPASPTPPPNNSELNSPMLYIHPPIALASYVSIFLLTIVTLKQKTSENKRTQSLALVTWLLTATGLFTGMLWAQIAWGSFWSWDAKETATLVLFLTLSAALVTYFEKKVRARKYLLIASCALAVGTALTSFVTVGLHSFL